MRFDGNPGNDPGSWWLSQDPATDLHHEHFTVYLAVVSQQLAAARAGTLAPSWREKLDTQPVPPRVKCSPLVPADADRTASTCLIYAKLAEVPASGELLACVRRDVASAPIAAWEPYATAGDWEMALRRWTDATLAVLRYQEALARRSAIRHPQRHNAWAGRPDPRQEDHQVACDLLVVSHLAARASATGQSPSGWRGELAERSRGWQDQHVAHSYRLALLDDFDTAWAPPGPDPDDPYALAFRAPLLPGPIPDYWTAPRPAKLAQ